MEQRMFAFFIGNGMIVVKADTITEAQAKMKLAGYTVEDDAPLPAHDMMVLRPADNGTYVFVSESV